MLPHSATFVIENAAESGSFSALLKPNRTPLQYPQMNTILRVRHLDRESDFPKLIEFLRSRHKRTSLPDYWTIGSRMSLYLGLFEGSQSNHHLWEDRQENIPAYTEVIPENRSWTIQIHPDNRDEQQILRMIDEVERFIDGHQ